MKQLVISILFIISIGSTAIILPVLSVFNYHCEVAEIVDAPEDDTKEKTELEVKIVFQNMENSTIITILKLQTPTEYTHIKSQYKPDVFLPPPRNLS